MAKNKIITSQGNVQFINSKGRTINIHPYHVYSVYEGDTVSFLFINMKDYSGQAFFASQYEDLELNGVTYDNMDDLKEALGKAFAKSGAQARTEIVEELPEDPYTNTIYLLPKEHGEGFDEYIWNEDEGWQLIGDTDIEWENYLLKTTFNTYSAATAEEISYISGAVDTNASDIVFLSGAVDTEISARTAADASISGAVDNVSSALTSEVQRAISAETALGNRIDTVNGRVDSEQLARANADNAISGAVDNISSVKANKTEAVASAVYVASSTTIDLKNINGEVISQVDASDFIIDGFVEDVKIENGYLVIDFNTASGVEDIQIPLTDIFNPDNYYDKDAVDAIVSGKTDTSAFTAHTGDSTIHVTTAQTAAWNAKSDFSGSYNDLTDKPTIPTVPTSNTAFTNDAGYITVDALSGYAESSAVTEEITAAVSGLQETLSAGTNIDITDNVISVTGISIETSSAITSGDTNAVAGGAVYDKFDEVEQVTARALIDLNDKFGGLKLQQITQSDYNNLQTKDPSTLYIIVN